MTQLKSKDENVKYPCGHCDYSTSHKGRLSRHVKSKHELVKYPCNHCDHKAALKWSLSIHIKSKHEGIKYPCNQCDYKATEKGHLLRHHPWTNIPILYDFDVTNCYGRGLVWSGSSTEQNKRTQIESRAGKKKNNVDN